MKKLLSLLLALALLVSLMPATAFAQDEPPAQEAVENPETPVENSNENPSENPETPSENPGETSVDSENYETPGENSSENLDEPLDPTAELEALLDACALDPSLMTLDEFIAGVELLSRVKPAAAFVRAVNALSKRVGEPPAITRDKLLGAMRLQAAARKLFVQRADGEDGEDVEAALTALANIEQAIYSYSYDSIYSSIFANLQLGRATDDDLNAYIADIALLNDAMSLGDSVFIELYGDITYALAYAKRVVWERSAAVRIGDRYFLSLQNALASTYYVTGCTIEVLLDTDFTRLEFNKDATLHIPSGVTAGQTSPTSAKVAIGCELTLTGGGTLSAVVSMTALLNDAPVKRFTIQGGMVSLVSGKIGEAIVEGGAIDNCTLEGPSVTVNDGEIRTIFLINGDATVNGGKVGNLYLSSGSSAPRTARINGGVVNNLNIRVSPEHAANDTFIVEGGTITNVITNTSGKPVELGNGANVHLDQPIGATETARLAEGCFEAQAIVGNSTVKRRFVAKDLQYAMDRCRTIDYIGEYDRPDEELVIPKGKALHLQPDGDVSGSGCRGLSVRKLTVQGELAVENGTNENKNICIDVPDIRVEGDLVFGLGCYISTGTVITTVPNATLTMIRGTYNNRYTAKTDGSDDGALILSKGSTLVVRRNDPDDPDRYDFTIGNATLKSYVYFKPTDTLTVLPGKKLVVAESGDFHTLPGKITGNVVSARVANFLKAARKLVDIDGTTITPKADLDGDNYKDYVDVCRAYWDMDAAFRDDDYKIEGELTSEQLIEALFHTDMDYIADDYMLSGKYATIAFGADRLLLTPDTADERYDLYIQPHTGDDRSLRSLLYNSASRENYLRYLWSFSGYRLICSSSNENVVKPTVNLSERHVTFAMGSGFVDGATCKLTFTLEKTSGGAAKQTKTVDVLVGVPSARSVLSDIIIESGESQTIDMNAADLSRPLGGGIQLRPTVDGTPLRTLAGTGFTMTEIGFAEGSSLAKNGFSLTLDSGTLKAGLRLAKPVKDGKYTGAVVATWAKGGGGGTITTKQLVTVTVKSTKLTLKLDAAKIDPFFVHDVYESDVKCTVPDLRVTCAQAELLEAGSLQVMKQDGDRLVPDTDFALVYEGNNGAKYPVARLEVKDSATIEPGKTITRAVRVTYKSGAYQPKDFPGALKIVVSKYVAPKVKLDKTTVNFGVMINGIGSLAKLKMSADKGEIATVALDSESSKNGLGMSYNLSENSIIVHRNRTEPTEKAQTATLTFTFKGAENEHTATTSFKYNALAKPKSIKLGKAEAIVVGDPQAIEIPISSDPADHLIWVKAMTTTGENAITVFGSSLYDWNQLNALFTFKLIDDADIEKYRIRVTPVPGAKLKAGSYSYTFRFAGYTDAKDDPKPVKLTVKVQDKPYPVKLSKTSGTMNLNLRGYESYATVPMVSGAPAASEMIAGIVDTSYPDENDPRALVGAFDPISGQSIFTFKQDAGDITTAKGKHVMAVTLEGANISTVKGKNVLKCTVNVVDTPITLTVKKLPALNLLDVSKGTELKYNYAVKPTYTLGGKSGVDLKTLLDDLSPCFAYGVFDPLRALSINDQANGELVVSSPSNMPTKAGKHDLRFAIDASHPDLGDLYLEAAKPTTIKFVKTYPKITAKPVTLHASAPYASAPVELDVPFGVVERVELVATGKGARYTFIHNTIDQTEKRMLLRYANGDASNAGKTDVIKFNVHLVNGDKPVTVSLKVTNVK